LKVNLFIVFFLGYSPNEHPQAYSTDQSSHAL